METGSDNGNDWRPELAAVSGAMPSEPEQRGFDACDRARACPSVRLHFPMVAVLGASFCDGVNRRRRPERHESYARANGKTPKRRERPAARAGRNFLRNAVRAKAPPPHPRPRPQRPPLSQAPRFPGGGSRLQLLHRAPPLLREQANTPPNSLRGRGARRTPSFGPTRRRASITCREPAITGTPATARICARLTRAPPAIALPGTASARPGTPSQ